MPHVIFQGSSRAEAYFRQFEPAAYSEGAIIRFTGAYLSDRRDKVLVETVVVESGRSRRFFLELYDRTEDLLVRLEPLTEPEKTEGVKQAIYRLALQIRSLAETSRVVKSTLGDGFPFA